MFLFVFCLDWGGRMIVSFGEFASAIGKSEPWLRKFLNEHPDFPVVSKGKNGVSYEIDMEKGAAYLDNLKAVELEAARRRQEQIQEQALDLFGGDRASGDERSDLSAQERKQLLEEELIAMKLARERGDLIRKDSVEEAIASALVKNSERSKSFSARLARRHDVPRHLVTAVDEMMEADQHACADELKRAVQNGNDSGENISNPSV